MRAGIPQPLYALDGDVQGFCAIMPDSDIANIGKSRQQGVAWICGDYIECVLTSAHFLTGVAPEATPSAPKLPETAASIAARTALRAQKQVRRIVNANNFRYMWTLTFCPSNASMSEYYHHGMPTQDQKNYDKVRAHWKSFVRRMYSAFGKFAWLVVFELHNSEKTSEEKRMTYHLHMATNIYMDWFHVSKVWDAGIVRVDDFQRSVKERGGKVRNPGAYMSKYVGKNFEKNFPNRKRYSTSRDCKKPKKFLYSEIAEWLVSVEKEECYRSEKVFEFAEIFPDRDGGEPVPVGGYYGVQQVTYRLK